jgi:hypothetical protein
LALAFQDRVFAVIAGDDLIAGLRQHVIEDAARRESSTINTAMVMLSRLPAGPAPGNAASVRRDLYVFPQP